MTRKPSDELLKELELTADDPLVIRLNEWTAPEPSAAESAVLTQTLTAALPKPARRGWLSQIVENKWVQLALMQLHIIRQEIWLASLLVIGLGLGVSLGWQSPGVGLALPFLFLAPVTAVVGVAVLYEESLSPVHELEMSTPTSARTLLLLRLSLLFGFNLVLGLVASLILSWWFAELAFVPLVSLWLAPMTFLTALAFFLGVVTGLAELGSLVSLTVWVMSLLHQIPRASGVSWAWLDLTAVHTHLWLWLSATFFTAMGVWLAGQPTHTFGQNRSR